jgi:Phosphotransferase enzyme family
MPTQTANRLLRLLGSGVASAVPVARGYTNNSRWLVTLADGRTAFVKQAVDASTSEWLRREHYAYAHLGGPWLPKLLAWADDDKPLLVLEDLSGCAWPPPWTAPRVDAVHAVLRDIARHSPPPGLRRTIDSDYVQGGWPEVARNPSRFLDLKLCSERWLGDALEPLLAAADPALLDGDALCHLDVRSDNLCLRDGQAVLVDWNLAAIGNPEFDLAFWLPSLHAEGGPPPQEVATVNPGVVALVAGFFASRAGLPAIPTAPRVRQVQRIQLAAALPWAAAVLGLPAPGPQRT